MIIQIIKLVRVRQWYKNSVVFLALFFSGNLYESHLLLTIFLAFISLCFISSAGYIINDLFDLKSDINHPEKKQRPIASGVISSKIAIFITFLLLLVGLLLAWILNILFFKITVLLFIVSLAYTLFFKHILFADLLTIGVLFVIRAISGALVIYVWISPWLILCPFFLSLFLSAGKRHADVLLLGNSSCTRKVLNEYTTTITNSLMNITTTLLIVSYSLYSFLGEQQGLLYTLPFVLFFIFRYYYLIEIGSSIARHPEKMFKDTQLIIGLILIISSLFVLLYY
jgi:4-hydroxybenzoate polyprenyltransferase